MEHETLRPIVDLERMSIREIGQMYRVLYHASFGVARALAGHCPLIAPLPEKWALIETVNTLIEHSTLYAARLPQVRVPLRLAAVPSEEVVETCRALARQPSWEDALGWTMANLLPKLSALCGEAHASSLRSQALMHDRRIFSQVCADLSRLATLSSCPPPSGADVPELSLSQVPPMAAGATPSGAFPLEPPPCPRRVYPAESRFADGPVKVPSPPDTPERVRALLHSNLQIEFVAVDVPMKNIADFHELPLEFYRDMARHAHDEMRHCKLLLGYMDEFGVKISDFPFESPDRFQTMDGHDLVYRLVVLSRTGESEAIEVAAHLMPILHGAGFPELANMFDHVLSDEIQHTAYANKWLRYLIGDDDERVAQVTHESLELNNRIALEVGLPKKPRQPDYLNAPRHLGIDALGRELAGFTVNEIESLSKATHK